MSNRMDWARYRALCDRPDVVSRWLVVETLTVLGPGPTRNALRAVLDSVPLEQPEGFRGPAAADMFEARLGAAEVRSILAWVERHVDAGGTALRRPAGTLAAWREYAAYTETSQSAR